MDNLFTCIPFEPEKQLGRAYNKFMELLGPEDWACFIDHDAMFLTQSWNEQLREIIKQNPDAGLITCVTNRIGCKAQKHPTIDSHDIVYHRSVAEWIEGEYWAQTSEVRGPVSGVLMCLSKKTWEQNKFTDGFLGVDTRFCQTLMENKKKILIAGGLYVYHWYRA